MGSRAIYLALNAPNTIVANDRLVLIALAEHTQQEGRVCNPGIARLANMAACSERTVQRAIQNLEAMGVLTVKRGDGRTNTSEYRINFDAIKGDTEDDKGCREATERVTPEQLKGDKSSIKGDTGDTRTYTERYEERNVEHTGTLLLSSEREERFKTFYASYPRHQAPDRARKAFFARTDAEQQRILDALPALKDRLRIAKTEPKYIPYPASWINGGDWKEAAATEYTPGNDARTPPPSERAMYFGQRHGDWVWEANPGFTEQDQMDAERHGHRTGDKSLVRQNGHWRCLVSG